MTIEGRLERTPDGAVWSRTRHHYPFWTAYLSAFDQVRVVARVLEVPGPVRGAEPVLGPGVEVVAVPHYLGPYQFVRRRRQIARAIRGAAGASDAVILRVPSPIGTVLASDRSRRGLPVALEVVGDPYGALAPRAMRHPLRPLLRRWLARDLRRQCRSAIGVSYVTREALQRRYPASPGAVTAAVSDVDLAPQAFVAAGRPLREPGGPFTLVSVGSLEQPYKGIDTLIEALARLVAEGRPVRLVHVGEGRYRRDLERDARRAGVADRVVFAGFLPSSEAVRRELDQADLFVMPSRTEGMPRALIEAMARGLPAVGSSVGGIPELLPPEFLVPPDDPVRLAAVVGDLLARPDRMAAASARNLERARDFSAEGLAARRVAYYRAVAERTVAGTPPGSPA